jgi:predicted Zn-dependent peptidase
VDTQNGVIKEEKELAMIIALWQSNKCGKENMFKNHPYRWSTIGSMEHLDTATLEDFKAFNKNSISNNAVLVVAGDLKSYQRMD